MAGRDSANRSRERVRRQPEHRLDRSQSDERGRAMGSDHLRSTARAAELADDHVARRPSVAAGCQPPHHPHGPWVCDQHGRADGCGAAGACSFRSDQDSADHHCRGTRRRAGRTGGRNLRRGHSWRPGDQVPPAGAGPRGQVGSVDRILLRPARAVAGQPGQRRGLPAACQDL